MAANYKVLQWNHFPRWQMSRDFMEKYKIDTLTIFPGVVNQELVDPVQGKKGKAKAKKAYNIMMSTGAVPKDGSRGSKSLKSTKVDATGVALKGSEPQLKTDEAGKPIKESDSDWARGLNNNMPEPVPYPDRMVVLKDTNLYEALKYVRPGHFLTPSETIPENIKQLPNARIVAFDIVPAKQQRLTIAQIARFQFSATSPKEHSRHILNNIWTHLLKGDHVTCQLAYRSKTTPKGYDFEWIWKNCVHLRPDVLQRALPSSTRLALGPLTNGNEVTWLVVPRNNIIDYMRRWKARQQEQNVLLEAGRGMLPKEERKAVKKELKAQLRAGKSNSEAKMSFSPMAMSVARLSINRRVDDILFKYEKLVKKIRAYIWTKYGRDRLMTRDEKQIVKKILHMESVDNFKFTPRPLIEPRTSKYAKLEAAIKRQSRWPPSEDDEKRRRRERAFSNRDASVVHEESNDEDTIKPTKYEEESAEDFAQERIETLRQGAQKDWEEDDPLNSLSDHKLFKADETPNGPGRRPDVFEHAGSPRTGLLSFMSKLETAESEKSPITRHDSERPPFTMRADEKDFKIKSSRLPSQATSRPSQDQPEIGPRNKPLKPYSNSNSPTSHDDFGDNASTFHNLDIAPFLPNRGFGSDPLENDQYMPSLRRPASPLDSNLRRKSARAPTKAPSKRKEVDEFAFAQKGKPKGSAKQLMLKAFKMDFAAAGKD
ncbi:hypothetical protein FKW77_006488 [Venturia effusa]|uniref:Uncharacterized protein n=1 Tax=Venturia effusa TaxID=50376 RepID=A0A517LJ67_9PEZI|nr:hypothetical protein FKW77_006488 [Venturia effusa]